MTEDIRVKIEQYGTKVDRLSICQEYDKLKLLIEEMERFKTIDEYIKDDTAFNYYLGTAYGTYSDYLVSSGKSHTDADIFISSSIKDIYDEVTEKISFGTIRMIWNF